MKRILFILLLTIISGVVFSQDTTTGVYNDQRGNFFIKAKNLPAWQIDGYNAVIRNGDTLKRIRNAGAMTAEELNILPNGSDMTSQINAVASIPTIKEIRFVSDSARKIVINGSANFNNVKLNFENGMSIAGTGTISNAIIKAGDYDRILDTTLSFSNIRSITGYLTPQNFGTKGDGTTDDAAYLNKVFSICSDNKVAVKIVSAHKVESIVTMYSNLTVFGDKKNSVIRTKNNIYFNSSVSVNNVTLKDLTFVAVDSVSNAELPMVWFKTSGTDTNIVIKNVDFYCNNYHGMAVWFNSVVNSSIQDCNVYRSKNQSIWIEGSKNVSVTGTNIYNAGRSGIAMYRNNSGVLISNFIVDGFAQTINLSDGAIDSYGPDNTDITIANGVIKTGTTDNPNGDFNLGIRMQGVRNVNISNVDILMQNNTGLYAIRGGHRDDFPAENVTISNCNIIITGKVLRIYSFQNAKNVSITGGSVKVMPEASVSATTMIDVANTALVDTIPDVLCNGITADFAGRPYSLVYTHGPTHRVAVSNSTFLNVGAAFLQRDSYIGNFTFNNNNVTTDLSGYLITCHNDVKSYIIIGNNIKKSTANFVNTPFTYTGDIYQNNNIFNGLKERPSGGGLYSAITFTGQSSTTEVAQMVGAVYTERTGGDATVTFNVNTPVFLKGKIVIVGNIAASGNYKTLLPNVYPTPDTLAVGETGMYQFDGTYWRSIANNKVAASSGGGGGSYDDTALRDSLLVHRNIIDDLSQNDTLNYKFYRGVGGTKADSLYVEFADTTFRVYAPVGGGGGTLPTKPSGYLLTGTGSAGYDSTGLYWDKVNGRVSVETNSPFTFYRKSSQNIKTGLSVFDSGNTERFWATYNENTLEAQVGTFGGSTKMQILQNGNTVINMQNSRAYFGGVISPTSVVDIAPSATSRASLRIREGTRPTSPNQGDIYTDNSDHKPYYYDGSSWYDLTATGGVAGVTSVSAGNGMSFSTITGTGSVVLGTPSNITLASTNSATSGTHTHAFVPGGSAAQIIRGNGTLSDSIGNGYVKFSTATNQYTASNLIPYSDISSPPTIPVISHGEYVTDLEYSSPSVSKVGSDTAIYTAISDSKVHVGGRIKLLTVSAGSQSVAISLPPSYSGIQIPGTWAFGTAFIIKSSDQTTQVVPISTLISGGGFLLTFDVAASSTYEIKFDAFYKYSPGGGGD